MLRSTSSAAEAKSATQTIISYDPLVSDTACHTRAAYLLYLARKVNKGIALSSDEESYLNACSILTAARKIERDEFGNIKFEATDRNKIPESALSDKDKASNTKRDRFLTERKREVAKKTIDFLLNECMMEFEEVLEVYKSNQSSIPLNNIKIPVLPLYLSAKIMLGCAASYEFPLAVTLKRIVLESDDNNYRLDNAVTIVYRVNAKKAFYVDKVYNAGETVESEPVISINMVNLRTPDGQNEVDNLFMQESFADFLAAFTSQDIAKLILIAGVGHPQYPDRCTSIEDDPILRTSNTGASTSSAEENTSITRCSLEEYRMLTGMATRYGFFRKEAKLYSKAKPSANNVDGKQNGTELERTKACIPFTIDHIYAADLSVCLLELTQLVNTQTIKRGCNDKPQPNLV